MKVTLRVRPEVYAAAKEAAAAERRSLNRQLEVFIEGALEQWRRQHPEGGADGQDVPRVAEDGEGYSP